MKVTKSKEWYYRASVCFAVVAWILCVLPTLVAGFIKLPSFVAEKNGTTLTGGAILVIVCCAYPLLKGLLKALKSPSAWLILWILAIVTIALYNVSRETLGALAVIFTVAAIGNSVGAILFWLSRQCKEKCALLGKITLTGGDET